MRRQAKSAAQLARMLKNHPAVSQVFYPGLLEEGDPQKAIYDRQCRGAGSLVSFEVKGGEAAAFKVLNAFEVARLAVSLGGTESLVEHPMSMTHSDVPQEMLEAYGVSSGFDPHERGARALQRLVARRAPRVGHDCLNWWWGKAPFAKNGSPRALPSPSRIGSRKHNRNLPRSPARSSLRQWVLARTTSFGCCRASARRSPTRCAHR